MKNSSIRVRFAPAPTGMMHLGNVRTALMNYLFAAQKGGTFVLRIEDTDQQRNYDPLAEKIIEDLTWLGIIFDEGPNKNEIHHPYFQSLRTAIYQERLADLFNKGLAYRCFCTPEELEKKRLRQIALKTPPRYDRTCAKLLPQQINTNLEQKIPFVWRVKLEETGTITINDLSHGAITFDLKNFSDFPLTRQDGTFTFMFANFVDDLMMEMTYVIRGEDHLTNTAGQALLYKAFDAPLPTFWHLPILCNAEGKKLSKRDFGFSLRDLKDAGFLPEAICNYLAIIGGSFKQEIMSLPEITAAFNFDNMHSTGQIRYDVEKLTWMNHKWIALLDNTDLAKRCMPYLIANYAQAKELSLETVAKLIGTIKTDLATLKDITTALEFYFKAPAITHEDLNKVIDAENIVTICTMIEHNLDKLDNPQEFAEILKNTCKQQNIGLKDMFSLVRMALTGSPKGPSIVELILMLGTKEAKMRLQKIID